MDILADEIWPMDIWLADFLPINIWPMDIWLAETLQT